MPQDAENFSVNNMRKFQKFTVASISHYGDIKTRKFSQLEIFAEQIFVIN